MNRRYQERKRRGGLSTVAVVFLLVLLLFPALSVLRLAQTVDFRFVFGYFIFVSAVTYLLYRHDKKRAQSGGWRTPESTLHLVELLGGWPGAFLAQRAFRHKISKASYQVTFWMIITLHEFAAFDFMNDWRYSGRALLFFHQMKSPRSQTLLRNAGFPYGTGDDITAMAPGCVYRARSTPRAAGR
jgi:uncharacterized membrane protein YsdA (DUF1294 family)